MNTTDSMVEKLSIHLYFQRLYTIMPAKGRKKLYHRRVSPIVRNGGLSSEIHIETMKDRNTSNPATVAIYTVFVLSFHAPYAP
jgi:hypothetical protein